MTLLALSGAGVLAIWSTTDGTSLNSYFGKQLIYLCGGLLAFIILINVDYHIFSDFIVFIYIGGMAVLALVVLIGRTIHGIKSWISVGLFSIQPSELVKIIVIIALAKYNSELDKETLGLKELAIGAAIAFAPVVLIMMEHDLGTALTFFPIYGVLTCLETKSGEPLFEAQKLEDLAGVYASPLGAAGRVYLIGRNGVTVVLKQSDKLEVLATNRLEEKFDASPAAVGKDLFLRGHEHLYCITEK